MRFFGAVLLLVSLAVRRCDGIILARGDDRAVLVAANSTGVGPRDAPWASGPFACSVVVKRRCAASGATYGAHACGAALPEGHAALGDRQAAPAPGYQRSIGRFACAEDPNLSTVSSATAPVLRASVLVDAGRRGVPIPTRAPGDVWRQQTTALRARDSSTQRNGAAAARDSIDSDAPLSGYGPMPASDPSGGACAAPRRGPIVCLETLPTGRGPVRVEMPGQSLSSASLSTAGSRCTCFMTDNVDEVEADWARLSAKSGDILVSAYDLIDT